MHKQPVIIADSTDPVDIMNSVMKTVEFDDYPSEYWERRIAYVCEIIARKNQRIKELEEKQLKLAKLLR